ncbi:MAG TPA: archease [Acidimicrobiales bacterium]|nr:archease [Acidimicrobiales bacterium]
MPTRGHRLLPHTADSVIEAWGPDRPACLSEALEALVDIFAQPADAAVTRPLPLSADAGPATDILVRLLEEVIYVTEVLGVVPVHFQLADTEDGGVSGNMEVVDAHQVELIGPVPKAVSYHGLEMAEHDGSWRCRALVDV